MKLNVATVVRSGGRSSTLLDQGDAFGVVGAILEGQDQSFAGANGDLGEDGAEVGVDIVGTPVIDLDGSIQGSVLDPLVGVAAVGVE